jgi:ICE2
MIINTYTALLALFHQHLPPTLHRSLNFAYTAITTTLSPSILTGLMYRISVLYAATRIIPAVRGVSQQLSTQPDLDSSEPSSKLMNIFILYSPIILIATYTNLLLSTLLREQGGWSYWGWLVGMDARIWAGFRTWRWINTFATLGLYAVEMRFGGDMDVETNGQGITGHWKVE